MPKNLNRMFGSGGAEKKWKKAHTDHISKYNTDYYSKNKPKIQAQRKIQRAESKRKNYNETLGF